MAIKAKVISVTPTEARVYLSKIQSNRDSDPRHVKAFERLMNEGKFLESGVIYFNGEDEPYDGQHRFQAQIRANYTATYIAVYGMNPEEMSMVIDAGKPRTNNQRLHSMNYVNASLLMTAAGIILNEKIGWRKSSTLFPVEVIPFIKEHPELDVYCEAWKHTKLTRGLGGGQLAAYQFLFHESDPKKVDEFLFALANGITRIEPAMAFRKMLDELPDGLEGNRRRSYIHYGIIRAWNAFKKGETLGSLPPSLTPVTIE